MADKTIVVRAVYRSNVAQGMRSDAGAISSLSAKVESAAGKSANATKVLGAASAVAGKLMILGVGGALAVSAKAAIDFESSMAGVAKTTDMAGNSFDRNSGPLFAFGEALRSMSLRVPINVNELAKIAELGGQLGIETPNLIEFTEVMAELGVATNLTAEEAATGFARFANIMRTPEDEFRRLGSTVVELGNNLATTESEILTFATRLAPVARTVGAAEEEVFALSGALSSLGIPAERGGTAVQRWMIQTKQAVDQGGDALERFAKVAGMTGEEFAKLFRDSPAAAFNAFVGGLDRLNKSGQDVFGTLESLQLSEVRTTQVLLAAAGGVDVLTESLDMANEAGDEATALQEEAARRFGTTASQIQILGNAFNDLRIEVGNAVLGSGGLAFALDVGKEFFGIIKDNLGVLEGLATVFGILVGFRIGVFFFQAAAGAQEAVNKFKNMAVAAQGLTTTAKLAQGGMLLLTASMQSALAVAGLLFAAWSIMAINAAQARAEVRQLYEEIESGVDPLQAFTAKVLEMLEPKHIDALNDLGFSVQDLIRHLMDGAPAASELGQALAQKPDFMEGTSEEVTALISDLVLANEAAAKAKTTVGGFFDIRKSDLVNAAVESGKALQFTTDQLDAMAAHAIMAFGYDISNEDFVNGLSNMPILMNEAENRGGQMSLSFIRNQRAMEAAMRETDMQWHDFLDPATKEDTMESFFEDNIEAVDGFKEAMGEAFDEIGQTIRGGFPVWGDYEKVVLGAVDETGNLLGPAGIGGALDAQRAFLEDTEDFVKRMPSILEMGASADTVKWLDELETPIRGAIGRLNDAQLQELIDGANANFDELNKLHLERWMQIYPDNANLAFAAMVGELTSRVDEMNLPGEFAAEAFFQGLMDMAATLPAENRDEFLAFLATMMDSGDLPYDTGYQQILDWIAGQIAGLQGMADKVIPIIDAETGKIKGAIKGAWKMTSPSKWWKEQGENMVAGLGQGLSGMSSVFSNITPAGMMPEQIAGAGSMSSVTNNRNASYALTVNGSSNNLHAEAQTLLTLLTIVGGVEHGAGR